MVLSDGDKKILRSATLELRKIAIDASNIANYLWAACAITDDHYQSINNPLKNNNEKMTELVMSYQATASDLELFKKALKETGHHDTLKFLERNPQNSQLGSQAAGSSCLNSQDSQRLDHISSTLIRDGDALVLSAALKNVVFDDQDIKIIKNEKYAEDRIVKFIEIYRKKAISLAPLRKALLDEAQGHIVEKMDNFQPVANSAERQQSPPAAHATAPTPAKNEKICGAKAADILDQREISSLWTKNVDVTELLPPMTPWFIREQEGPRILAKHGTGDRSGAAGDLRAAIVAHFRQEREDICLQDVVEVLKDTRKYQKLISAIEKAMV